MANEAAGALFLDIARLSRPDPIQYDKVRKAEADALGIRASTLDGQVQQVRRQLGGNDDDGAGASLTFDSIEPWPSSVDGAELLDEISAIFTRHAVLPEYSAMALALWSAFSHMHQSSAVCPNLVLTSLVKGCGKTTVLDTLQRVVNRPLATSNITASAMFRAIEKWTPTLLIDEADSFARDNEELRGVLNSGHTRPSAFVLRTVGDQHEVRQFSTWCPKALAGIGKLPGTVMDRSVIVPMRRKSRGESVERLRPRQRYDDARSKIARWAADHLEQFAKADPAIPGDLANRTADNWTPLIAIADLAGGDWPERARKAALAMSNQDVEADGVGVRLLADMKLLFDAKCKTRYPTAELLRDLIDLDESPWSEFNRGKPINPRGLGRLLGDFDIVAGTIRIGADTSKGYKREQFEDAFSRYLAPDAPFPPSQSVTPTHASTDAGCDGISKRHAEEMCRIEIPTHASTGAGCDDVTDSNPGNSGFAQSAVHDDRVEL